MNEDLFQLGIKALVTNTAGEILLLKVNIAKLKKFAGEPYYDLPGGRLHRGSTIEETLRREVVEETGIFAIKIVRPLLMCLSNIRIPMADSDTGLILGVYVCQTDEVHSITLSDEHTEYGWFSPKEASELLKFKYPADFIELLQKTNL